MSAYAAIHTGLRALGIDQEDARDIYERQTGKRSLRDMSAKDHEAVIGELRRMGFKPASKGSRKPLTGRFAKKLQALWIAGWNLGIVRDRTDNALLAFVGRQTGLDHVRFLHDPADARKAIEALKSWLGRESGVDWSIRKNLPPTLNDERYRIAWAQYRVLVPGATSMGNLADFLWQVGKVLGRDGACSADLSQLSDRDWQTVMNAFGERIRKAKSS